MSTSEVFSKRRINRCCEIARDILLDRQASESLSYVARSTEPLAGVSLADLRKQYFTVGAGDKLQDIPFTDMLVVFSIVEREWSELEKRKLDPKGRMEDEISIVMHLTTDFSDHEAARIINGIRIETPFDDADFVRIRLA